MSPRVRWRGGPSPDVSAMTSVHSLIEGKRIVICAGSGGVGKTTTAAALGLGMAERGLRVAVVTIDPARRLATSLGLEELGDRVAALLEDPATTFLIVSSPRHDPSEEAILFHRKLADAAMPFGGLVVNRVHISASVDGDVPGLAEALGDDLA